MRPAQARDDWVEMCRRRLQQRPPQAQEARADERDPPQEPTAALVARRGRSGSGGQARDSPAPQRQAVDARMGGRTATIRAQWEAQWECAGDPSVPCLRPLFRPQRTLCLEGLEVLPPPSTRAATALAQASACVRPHRRTRAGWLPGRGEPATTGARWPLSWSPPRWGQTVTGPQRDEGSVETVDQRFLARCVLACGMGERTAGDLGVAGREPCSA